MSCVSSSTIFGSSTLSIGSGAEFSLLPSSLWSGDKVFVLKSVIEPVDAVGDCSLKECMVVAAGVHRRARDPWKG